MVRGGRNLSTPALSTGKIRKRVQEKHARSLKFCVAGFFSEPVRFSSWISFCLWQNRLPQTEKLHFQPPLLTSRCVFQPLLSILLDFPFKTIPFRFIKVDFGSPVEREVYMSQLRARQQKNTWVPYNFVALVSFLSQFVLSRWISFLCPWKHGLL